MPHSPEDLYTRLDGLGINVRKHSHPPLYTVEDSRNLRGEIPGGHCKNLFLKDKKGALWLVVTLEDAEVEMKRLHAVIGSARLSFGKPDLLLEALGVTPGAVTPLALINDAARRVNVVLDAAMMAHEELNFHPLTNDATVTIGSGDLVRFIEACGHEPAILPVDTSRPQA